MATTRPGATTGGVTTATRYVVGAEGMTVTHTVGGGTTFTLPAPHGDTSATSDATGLVTAISDYDEFGVPRTTGAGDERYGWLAKQQRQTDPDTDLILMGVRAYDPPSDASYQWTLYTEDPPTTTTTATQIPTTAMT